MIKKIIITGDILRPKNISQVSHQNSNIINFYNAFKYHLSKVTGLPVEFLLWNENHGFNTKLFYNFNNLEVSQNNWAKLYDGELLLNNDKSLKYYNEFVKDSLVIGFELSDGLSDVLTKLNINYVDIAIHPIRYLDDIFLMFRTNNPEIYKLLNQYIFSDEIFHIQAGFHKAALSKKTQLPTDYKRALLVGQTINDRSLIKDKEFVSLLDYKEEIEKLNDKYQIVYYKAHPLETKNRAIYSYLNTLPSVQITGANIYHLLCQECITEVNGINSSVLTEAQYFGKEVKHFYKTPCQPVSSENTEFDKTNYIPIYNDYFDPGFWANILSPVLATQEYDSSKTRLMDKPNRLRIILQSFWAYSFLDSEMLLEHSIYKK